MKSQTSPTLDDLRKEEAMKALRKLKYETIPSLQSVIAGTPTGPVRDQLTDANIILLVLTNDVP